VLFVAKSGSATHGAPLQRVAEVCDAKRSAATNGAAPRTDGPALRREERLRDARRASATRCRGLRRAEPPCQSIALLADAKSRSATHGAPLQRVAEVCDARRSSANRSTCSSGRKARPSTRGARQYFDALAIRVAELLRESIDALFGSKSGPIDAQSARKIQNAGFSCRKSRSAAKKAAPRIDRHALR
jgi:hypothetical protein